MNHRNTLAQTPLAEHLFLKLLVSTHEFFITAQPVSIEETFSAPSESPLSELFTHLPWGFAPG